MTDQEKVISAGESGELYKHLSPVSTDQEKKDVLHKFAGFNDAACSIPGHLIYPDGCCLPGPDLLHSLDAQAKWVWPKLTPEQLGALFVEIASALFDKRDPAEACAEAILSLIGEDE